MTLFHCAWVTSYLPSQKPFVNVTLICGHTSCDSWHGESFLLPIMYVPGGHQIISIVAPPGSVTVLVLAAVVADAPVGIVIAFFAKQSGEEEDKEQD